MSEMRATRDLLIRVEAMAGFYRHSDGFFRLGREARAEVEAMERVVEAAREVDSWRPQNKRTLKHLHPQERAAVLELRAALAELDGQR